MRKCCDAWIKPASKKEDREWLLKEGGYSAETLDQCEKMANDQWNDPNAKPWIAYCDEDFWLPVRPYYDPWIITRHSKSCKGNCGRGFVIPDDCVGKCENPVYYDEWGQPLTTPPDDYWFEEESRCARCGTPWVPVRPGKSQPNCDCELICDSCGQKTIRYHLEGEYAPNISGYFCSVCGPYK